MVNKRFCRNCGKEIPDGSKFCRFCGNQQYEPEEKKQFHKGDGYFVSHWKFSFFILGPAFIFSLLYGLFITIGFFVLEIIASLFGYCITGRGQECSGTGVEIVIIPLALGGFYFIYGAFSVMKRALIVIAQSPELKLIFGLSEQPKTINEYFASRGINTLFFPKYVLLLLIFLLLLITNTSLETMLVTIGAVVIISDLRFLKWLFIKSLKLNKYKLETTAVNNI